ncbi:MAG: modified peptide precursor CbpA [Magnetococcales bacterium]|nr:modified peptide precursor CbpA [Magnetococcales bacterium]
MECPYDVLAQRKSCTAEGVGLSHYILMDKKLS